MRSTDMLAEWFNIYILGPNFSVPVNNQWYSTSGALFESNELSLVAYDGTSYSALIPQNFALVGSGEYTVWIQGWGTPDGTSASGQYGKGGTASFNGQVYGSFNTVTLSSNKGW